MFTARLGFVGVDFGPVGRMAIGKQTAVHYDVTSYTTDRFNVFGGQGTSTYVAGTDGGATGTGFADRVVNYRNTLFKILEVGIQGQFRGGKDSEGAGASLQLTILPGVKVGGAYTRTNWSQNTRDLVREPGRRRRVCRRSARASTGASSSWGWSTRTRSNGDMVQVPFEDIVTPVAFDADGVELYLHGQLKRLGLIGGFTYQNPNVRDPLHRSRLQHEVRDSRRRVVRRPDRQDLHREQDRSRQRLADGSVGRQRVHDRLPLRLLVARQPQVAPRAPALGRGVRLVRHDPPCADCPGRLPRPGNVGDIALLRVVANGATTRCTLVCYFGVIFEILLPWRPMPAISPFCPKTNA